MASSASGLTAGPGSQLHSIQSKAGGGERTYRIHLPHKTSVPTPLILALHGKAQDSSTFESETQLSNPEVNNGSIVVYPQGSKDQWTGDPEAPPPHEIDDVAFIMDLLNHLEEQHRVDKRRIFVTGFSNGGGLAHLLACNSTLSRRIAAFAIASGAFYKASALHGLPLFERCEIKRSPIPIMEFHGSKDPVIHYDGKTTPDGPTFSLPKWLDDWAKRNKCDDVKRTMEYDGNVERSAWSRDGQQEVLVHYYIHGFGHGWPTTRPLDNDDQRHGPTYFNATPIILDFFKKWPLLDSGGTAAIPQDEL